MAKSKKAQPEKESPYRQLKRPQSLLKLKTNPPDLDKPIVPPIKSQKPVEIPFVEVSPMDTLKKRKVLSPLKLKINKK